MINTCLMCYNRQPVTFQYAHGNIRNTLMLQIRVNFILLLIINEYVNSFYTIHGLMAYGYVTLKNIQGGQSFECALTVERKHSNIYMYIQFECRTCNNAK